MVTRSQGHFKIMINGAKVKKAKIIGLKESKNVKRIKKLKNIKKTTKIISYPWCPPTAPLPLPLPQPLEGNR